MNASMICENCPVCLSNGRISVLKVDLSGIEVLYTCPMCGSVFSEPELERMYLSREEKRKGG